MARGQRTSTILVATTVAWSLLTLANDARADKAACLAAYDAGQRERLAGHLVVAREATLRCAQADCPAMLVKECTQWTAEIAAELPSVVVSVQDGAGVDVHDASISIDGVAVATRIDGRALTVDPGARTIVVVRGPLRAESTIVVRQREQGRLVALRFPSPPAEKPITPPGPIAPAAAPPSRTLGWIAGGVSLAAAGGFVGFGLWARSARDDLRDTCAPYCGSGDLSAAKTKAYVADGFLALSIVAAGVSVYGFVRGNDRESQTSTTVWLGPSGGGLRGSF